jgi:hypothetical protein
MHTTELKKHINTPIVSTRSKTTLRKRTRSTKLLCCFQQHPDAAAEKYLAHTSDAETGAIRLSPADCLRKCIIHHLVRGSRTQKTLCLQQLASTVSPKI